MDVKLIPDRQLVQAGEQLGAGQAAVAGEHGVAVFAADGQRGRLDMADAFLQDLLAGAVVDGQVNADLGDGDAAHHAVHIQDLFVIFGQGVAAAGHKGVMHGVPGKVFVVFFGQGPLFGQGGLVLGFNGGLVGLHNAGLVFCASQLLMSG